MGEVMGKIGSREWLLIAVRMTSKCPWRLPPIRWDATTRENKRFKLKQEARSLETSIADNSIYPWRKVR